MKYSRKKHKKVMSSGLLQKDINLFLFCFPSFVMLSIICCISSICTADQETQEENTVYRHLEKKGKQEIDGPGCSYFEAATPNNPALSAEL